MILKHSASRPLEFRIGTRVKIKDIRQGEIFQYPNSVGTDYYRYMRRGMDMICSWPEYRNGVRVYSQWYGYNFSFWRSYYYIAERNQFVVIIGTEE